MNKPEPLPEDRFFNRELSWLEFNQRVLDHADDENNPALERLKFLAITSSNLDEFFMVRVGGLILQSRRPESFTDPSGLSTAEQLSAIRTRYRKMVDDQYRILLEDIEPTLLAHGIARVTMDDAGEQHQKTARSVFQTLIQPVLSPQIVSSGEFPLVQVLSIQLCVRLKGLTEETPWDYAIIPLGRAVGRVVTLPTEGGYAYALLEDVVTHHIDEFFNGREVAECIAFRVTRNADIAIQEDSARDLMVGMEELLESRRTSGCVRLEIDERVSEEMLQFLSDKMDLCDQNITSMRGPLDLTYLFQLAGLKGFSALRDPHWAPQHSPEIDPAESMFDNIAQRDLLLLHPYEQFDPVVRLIQEAAEDPDVLAIKQVLYRTSRNSPIVAALMRAAERGKYVTAIVELKARFDEARNIEWAREMEASGVQVVYGVRGLKTHAKICIVVRRETQGIARYVHFGTGNYNEATAALYGDVSMMTCNEEFGADATNFFNSVIGASQPQQFHQLSMAPTSLRTRVLSLIENETRRRAQGQRAVIVAKMNALVDNTIIDALYRASQAGVKIKLNIRGICCLKPGVPGLSENIEVTSIIDRFLEHARIAYFHHGGDEAVFISSADWMPRNLDRRVELFVPVQDTACRQKLLQSLDTYFQDNVNAWQLGPDGVYTRKTPTKGKRFRAQEVLYNTVVAEVKKAEHVRRTHFETHQAEPK
ncbi:Polyphosphate kinase [Rosistilla carotiformis]|uniref:Polyphosphate kinase n=1 Tax=Rosistilla carotiformis TaxID=2528017 RepID=A0A518JMG7_9BACT|nr:polyphosphate kinase 1 [Rosistilla carotiformis]QDV66728.1 Polyphosphate kinase [Rosistilla carotiformis]